MTGRNGPAPLRPAIAVLAAFASDSVLPQLLIDSVVEDNPVVFANDAYLAMTGASRGHVLARPIMELLSGAADIYTLSLFQAALVGGEGGLWQMRLQREDEASFPGMVYLTAIRDADANTVGHSIAIADLAALLCMSHEREPLYSAIYDKAPGFIAISRGENHRYEYANESYRELVQRDDLVGKTIAEALPEIADEGFLAMLDEVYRTGVPFRASDLPVTIRDPATGGWRKRWIDVLNQPLRDQDGAIIGLFCEGHDVTDRHEMNEAIAVLEMKVLHASRSNAMGTMASTLGHELNQPLTAITNYLAGVRPVGGHAPDMARLLTALSGIKEAAERASAIIDHLRLLTKNRSPRREPFDLRDAVEETVRVVRSHRGAASTFNNQIAPGVIMNADRVQIQQVMINLLQNACEAMTGQGPARVTIAATQDEQGLTVCVADTGPGISPEARATMFAWTETVKEDGMGIGLSICRTLVELYGGSIWLEKTGAEGSEFRFSLPSPDHPSPDHPAPDLPPPAENADNTH